MLRLENLSVAYGPVQAVKNLSMEVPDRSIIALIGANGAGKSSLLSAISGLNPYTGKIFFNDEPLPTKPYEVVKKGIVQIPEGRMIFSNLTIYENLLCGAYTDWNRQRIEENLERVYALFPLLKQRVKQYAGTLSGGERQMLALGRGLMSRPKLLLVDEPSLGLAPLLVQQVLEMIQEINKQGTTILLVEQNARKSLSISDYAYVLQNGELVRQGTGKELLNDPAIQEAYLGGKH
jgi:branched-chain amino acid transport system ATP-binding protein